MKDKAKGFNTLIGLAAIGPAAVGILSFAAALLALLSGEFVGAGMLLVAAGLSLGLLCVAVLGK